MDVSDEQIRAFIIVGEGSSQGAVDGSFFFSLAINYALIKMNEVVRNNGGGAFLAISDGITGAGEPVAVALAIIFMIEQFEKMGLVIHISKCVIFLENQHIIDEVLQVDKMSQN